MKTLKVVMIMNDATQTCESAILSRELCAEELQRISALVHHWHGRTVHYVDCLGPEAPFEDIFPLLESYRHKVEEDEAAAAASNPDDDHFHEKFRRGG